MSNIELYRPLLELASAISECNEELKGKPDRKRKAELQKAIQNMEKSITEKSTAIIDRTVDTWSSDKSLSSFLASDLDAIKSAADESWHVAIDDVKVRLDKLARREGRKSRTRRKFEKNLWWITIAVVVITAVSLKWYWLVEVSEPIESAAGIVQRAGALEKLLDYEDLVNTRVRRGGWLKEVLFWPAEATEEEVTYASEFLWAAVEVYDYLVSEGTLCNLYLSHDSGDENYKNEIAIAQIAIDYINHSQNISGLESGPLLISNSYTSKFPCQQ